MPAAPTRRTDKALGWTGVGVTAAFCVPLAPLAGVVLAVVALARRRFRPRWVLVLCLVAGLGLTALQASLVPSFVEGVRDGVNEGLDDEAERARESGERKDIPVLGIERGDCLDDPHISGPESEEQADVETVELVPCDEPHDGEVYATVELADDSWPGAAAIDRRAIECADLMAAFVGVRWAASGYDMYFYFPSARTWKLLDDRTIHCVITHSGQKLTGSLKGAGRVDLPAMGEAIAIDRLVVGDCYNNPGPQSNADMLVLKPCAQPHDSEVFAVVDLKRGKYPGDAEVVRRTESRCSKIFRSFVGVRYDDSELGYTYWTADKQIWAAGDRSSICALSNENGAKLKGSAKGSRR